MSETIWERRDCVSAEVEQSLVLLDLDTLLYHSLNRTAASIWELLETPRSAAELADALCQRYDVAYEPCHASVGRTLDRLKELGLIAPAAAAAAFA